MNKIDTMSALCKTEAGIEIKPLAMPIRKPDRVLLRVELAGVCRTDIDVANGILPVKMPRIMGHEFSAIVVQSDDLPTGMRVAVNPIFPCKTCCSCVDNQAIRCVQPTMLGVDLDGAFAEYISVPRSAVFKVDQTLSASQVAFIEPIAATLAIVGADMPSSVAIIGSGRIATLSGRVLMAVGIQPVQLQYFDDLKNHHQYTYIIESTGTAVGMQYAALCAAPGGTVILKSRKRQQMMIDMSLTLHKELNWRGVHYKNFAMAINWVEQGRIQFDDLLGTVFPIKEWQIAFNASEATKVFLRPGDLST